MTQYTKKFNYLQRLSKRQLEAADRARLEREIYYPELFVEPDVWYENTLKDRFGKEHTMRLLNREGERNDSYIVEYMGHIVYVNRFGRLVLNETRKPLVLGLSESMRFMAKQFPRISRRHDEG
jgi:hypothetical protein